MDSASLKYLKNNFNSLNLTVEISKKSTIVLYLTEYEYNRAHNLSRSGNLEALTLQKSIKFSYLLKSSIASNRSLILSTFSNGAESHFFRSLQPNGVLVWFNQYSKDPL